MKDFYPQKRKNAAKHFGLHPSFFKTITVRIRFPPEIFIIIMENACT